MGHRAQLMREVTGGRRARNAAYWGSTEVAAVMLVISLIYFTGNEQVVSGFAKSLATGDVCGAIGRDVQFRHGVTKM